MTTPPTRTQSLGRSFESWYEDYAYGGSLEFGTDLIPMNTLKGAVHYRRDNHTEFQLGRPDDPASTVEPDQHNTEDTWSVAVEDTFHATQRLDFIVGVSYDKLAVRQAQDYDSANGLYENPTTESDGYNYQGGAIYALSPTGKVHATVSGRIRFPTIFERYSTRFGLAIPNPDLGPERSTNYEVGWSDKVFRDVRLSATAFYAKLKDSIQPVYVSTKSVQNQNIDGEHYGIELTADWDIAPGLRVGGNYTYLERDLDFETPRTRAEGTPQHEAFLYLAWDATRRLTITPSVQLASDRYSLKTSDTSLTYIKTGSYALLNMQADYKLSENVTLAVGAKNLFDEYYELSEGFPEPGRTLYASMKAKF